MKLKEVQEILNCRVLAGADRLEVEAEVGCGADLMSDVLAFIKPNALLLTGLTNVQSVRAADVAGVKGIVYVRGKMPDRETVELAQEKGMILLATDIPMYEACGRLYARGLRGGSESAEGLSDDRRATVLSKF
ncbi:MAG: DRTGG domain-containing protein [Bryobacteraceae bacterium]